MRGLHGSSWSGLLVVLGSIAWGGCTPIGTFQSPTTVKPGFWHAQVRPEVMNPLPDDTRSAALGMDVEVRYGVHQQADMGLRFGSSGLAFDGKQRIVSSDQFNVAVNPGVGLQFYKLDESSTDEETGEVATWQEHVGTQTFSLPLIMGYQPARGGAEVVLAPKIIVQHMTFRSLSGSTLFNDGRVWELLGGLSLGVRLPLPGGLALFPEVTVGYPMATASSTSLEYATSDLRFTAGLGLGFGPQAGRYYNSGDSLPY